mmetsp:Transcript_100763/g.285623  ORF Transcript_100763/g.285623 Transcript_100763/m.285623 type:complete len:311 (+) Transcript_100763:1546-2478(+)
MVAQIHVVVIQSAFSWQYLYHARHALWIRSAAMFCTWADLRKLAPWRCLFDITSSRCLVELCRPVRRTTRDVRVEPLMRRLGLKSCGAVFVAPTACPVRSASMMSMRASGWSSMACTSGVFLGPLVVASGAVMVASPTAGTPRSRVWASRSDSLAWGGIAIVVCCVDCGENGGRWAIDCDSSLLRGPPLSVERAKFDQADSSLAIHSAASWRTDRCGIGNVSSLGWGWAPGSTGSMDAVLCTLGPFPERSELFMLFLRVAPAAIGDLVDFCDFCSTASQFCPSVIARGWSSPKHRFATWWPCWNAAAAFS